MALILTFTPTIQAEAEHDVASETKLCPGSSEIADAPKMRLISKAGPTLMICGFEEVAPKEARKKRSLSEMKIYSIVKNEAPRLIFESSSLETHWLRELPKEGVALDEIWQVAGRQFAALKFEIRCKASGCEAEPPHCGDTAPRHPFPHVMKELEKPTRSKAAAVARLDILIEQAFAEALGGNEKAQAYFLDRPEPESLDGAFAEDFHRMKKHLARAKTLGCLK
jgi:hypothetical protein